MRVASLTVFLTMISLSLGEAPEKTIPAVNEIEPWQQVGQQPYELTWTQREEHPDTLVDFEDLSGWNLELFQGAEGKLYRSREQQMWGQSVAKFLYSGTGAKSRIVARPPKPIPILERFDSIELWGYGNRWSWVSDPTTPAAEVSILIRDSRDKEFRIQLTDIRWKQWWLIHRQVPEETLNEIVWPASFSGIEISEGGNSELRYFFCDSLVFYEEELKPLEFKAQPKRNLKPYRGQIVGLNTGSGRLPFPTREETILPTNFETDYEVHVQETGQNEFELTYTGRDAKILWRYRPRTGTLADLTVSVNGGSAFRPMDGGGIRFTDTPQDKISEGKLVSAKLNGDAIETTFRHGSRIVDQCLRLWQKSLVLDIWCDGGDATELSFGRVTGVSNPQLITVPYLTYRETNPRILMSGPREMPIFSSIWFDWYRTNATQAFSAEEPEISENSAEINGGMRYIPKTDGIRNNLYERIFVTTSPTYEETLPTTANPPSVRQKEGSEVLWTVSFPQSSFREDHERCRRIRSYGIDKIMQHSHEITWRDEGDSNTMKLRASPQKGGDAALAWYIRAQNSLGWLQGVYSNYTDFCTVNTNWSPDWVTRLPDGEWRRAWPRNYMLKPSKAVEFDDYYAKRIKEKFGVKMSYTDVHTCAQPWRCDFDSRVPGAGTMAALFYAYGQLLLNDQNVYGPTQSEATFQWLYAGLQSGGYGWVYTDVNLLTHPLDVSFMLMKIHPLEADYGMGYTFYYLSRLDGQWKESAKKRDYVDLFLATTIGYGNMGWLVTDWGLDDPFGVEAMARSYYMMQQLQQEYAFTRPQRIEYASADGRMLTPSEAHASEIIADSRLHVQYENGTHVYVNRSQSGTWMVTDHRGRTVELPSSGWLVYNSQNEFYELSASVGGRRIDWVTAPDYEFLDGRGKWTEHGTLGATGSVARRQRSSDVTELIDIYGNDRIAFKASVPGHLIAYDWEGQNLGQVEAKSLPNGWHEFHPVKGGRMYLFARRDREGSE